MNLTITNGTPQQQQWVNDAIAQCSYPLKGLPANVVVTFMNSLPVSLDLGHQHTYMVTTSDGLGGFVISIASWADDPTHPDNQGLPNPGLDIYDFFKQSFVHELGHVTHFSLLVTDPLRSQAAQQFWTVEISGGSGRRYGKLGDFGVNIWTDNMMEAIAEVYKVTFYGGRLIFGNRSSWQIDEPSFGTLMGLLLPPLLPTTGRTSMKVASLDFVTPAPAPPGGETIADLIAGFHIEVGNVAMWLMLDETRVAPFGADGSVSGVDVAGSATAVLGISDIAAAGGWGPALGTSFLNPGPTTYNGAIFKTFQPGGSGAGENAATHCVGFDRTTLPLPFWVALNITDAICTAEVWATDPVLGGSPFQAVTVPMSLAPEPAGPLWNALIVGVTTVGDLIGAFGEGTFDDVQGQGWSDDFTVDDLASYSLVSGNAVISGGALHSTPCNFILEHLLVPTPSTPPPYPMAVDEIFVGPPQGGVVGRPLAASL